MIQNDYRRALIMLRGLDKGLTGHVRLERRTMVGSLQFSVSGLTGNDQLYAALMTNAHGRWRGSVLGQLGRDARGQAGLNASFDPRSIDGLELEQYDIIAVLRDAAEGAQLAMCGFVNGSKNVDWAQVHEAVAGLLGRTAAIEPKKSNVQAESVTALRDEAASGLEPKTGIFATANTDEPDIEVFTSKASIEDTEPIFIAVNAEGSGADGGNSEDAAAEAGDGPIIITVRRNERGALEDAEGNAFDVDQSKMPAGLLLDLDITNKWPESIEQLRSVFLNEPSFTPFDADGFVFVRAPLPANGPNDYCAVGIQCENRAPAYVCYAIPGSDPSDPPPGLEEYSWVDDGNSGWWKLCLNVETGERVES